jgi:hypothetical protein
LFWFAFYEVILVSWSKSWIWQINLSQIKSFFLFSFYEVILVSWSESWVWWIDWGHFLCSFLVPSFNIAMIRNWTSYFFYFISMGLSQSYDPSCKFDRLTRVVFLGHFFNWVFFFNFILQHWVDWKLDFIICFNLFSMGLS